MNRAPPALVAGVLAACSLAVPLISHYEGRPQRGYADVGGVPTSCYGHTGPDAVVGRVYTDDECARQLAQDAVAHGLDIAKCLPRDLPEPTRAAFTSFAFNVGAPRFCASALSAKARAGDLKGACAELDRWVFAAGRKLPGLVARRAAERELCEEGL